MGPPFTLGFYIDAYFVGFLPGSTILSEMSFMWAPKP